MKIYLLMLGCKVGRGLKALSFPVFREIPRANIEIGNHMVLGKGVVFEIVPEGRLQIGDYCTLGDHNRISTNGSITIGHWVSLAEHVGIRGSFHQTSRSTQLVKQPSVTEPITIGSDVGIGAFTLVLMGTSIPDGVVIGGHSLIKRSDKLHAYGIFAGSPLKHIRNRE